MRGLSSHAQGFGFSFSFFFQFESSHRLLTDQITEIIKVDTLVHPSNKPIDLVPASPPSRRWVVFFFITPSGEDNWKGHGKLFASLKRFPTEQIS